MCFVHGQSQKREQKHTTKNFVGFHNHSSLLTMAHLNKGLCHLLSHVSAMHLSLAQWGAQWSLTSAAGLGGRGLLVRGWIQPIRANVLHF